jgi:hypothetical protein
MALRGLCVVVLRFPGYKLDGMPEKIPLVFVTGQQNDRRQLAPVVLFTVV